MCQIIELLLIVILFVAALYFLFRCDVRQEKLIQEELKNASIKRTFSNSNVSNNGLIVDKIQSVRMFDLNGNEVMRLKQIEEERN